MISRISKFFRAIEDPAMPVIDDRQLAAAALMVEAAYLDGSFEEVERNRILAILQSQFELTLEEAEELLDSAHRHQADSNHLLRFTQAIKEAYGQEGRIQIIEMLWEVAYADGELHHYEANLLRRIGGLIYVSDKERGDARKRVLAKLSAEKA